MCTCLSLYLYKTALVNDFVWQCYKTSNTVQQAYLACMALYDAHGKTSNVTRSARYIPKYCYCADNDIISTLT